MIKKHLWAALSILPCQVSRGDFADRSISFSIFIASPAIMHGHLEISDNIRYAYLLIVKAKQAFEYYTSIMSELIFLKLRLHVGGM